MVTAVSDTAMRTGPADARPWRGDDFPDWLSPMLVRELRQGMQSGAFTWTFLLLQAALLVHAAGTVFATSGPFAGQASRERGVFWTILVVGVVVVLPLRGLAAISAERAANNLDLVQLTRLSAMRIVVGKWAALVVQVLLVTAAVLPYLVLRYFLGGIDVLTELVRVGWLVVAAAVVAALAVYYSTRPVRERIALLLLSAFGGWSLLLAATAGRSAAGMAGPGGWFWLGMAAVYTALCLEAAAASIAAASANHALFKRSIGLACGAVIAGVGFARSLVMFVYVAVACGLPLLLLAVGALCERPVRFRRLHAAFDRGGIVGRAAAAVLTPGWATGLVFVAVAGGLTAAGFLAHLGHGPLMTAAVCLAAAAIVFPLPALVLLPRLTQRTTLYVGLQAVCLVVFGIEAVLREASRTHETLFLVMPFPLAGLLRLFGVDGSATAAALAIAALAVLALVAFFVAGRWFREMRETQRLVSGGRSA